MPVESDEPDYHHLWDVSRRTVESFDRTIASIRQMYLLAVGVIAAGATTILNGGSGEQVIVLLALSCFLFILTVIFWLMDAHYHDYLKIAAATCERLENKMSITSERLGISAELSGFRKDDRFRSKSFMWMYIVIGIGSICIFLAVEQENQVMDSMLDWLIISGMMASYVITFVWSMFYTDERTSVYILGRRDPEDQQLLEILNLETGLDKEKKVMIIERLKRRYDRLLTTIGTTTIFIGLIIFLIAFEGYYTIFNVNPMLFIDMLLGGIFILGVGVAFVSIPGAHWVVKRIKRTWNDRKYKKIEGESNNKRPT